ncbi:hypothetical protein [Microbacterium sp.]|uniref:hypothetical protein n=1 Tax=Microbacterium sp. TaxID=51671 RepID=UPI002618D2FC|nr:hypothetical protein [Microbacterium sp.]
MTTRTIPVTIFYTNGTSTTQRLPVSDNVTREIDRFRENVKRDWRTYRNLGVMWFRFQITEQYAEEFSLASLM